VRLPWVGKRRESSNRVIRGEDGRSARQRCFDLFDEGRFPAEVADLLGIKKPTARRYHAQWADANPRLKARYQLLRQIVSDPTQADYLMVVMKESLGFSEDQAREMLRRPSELVALLVSKWPRGREVDSFDEILARARVATDIARFLEETGWDLGRARQDIVSILTTAARFMAAERSASRWPSRPPRRGRVATPYPEPELSSEERREDADSGDKDRSHE
jgi:hypothetical protein